MTGYDYRAEQDAIRAKHPLTTPPEPNPLLLAEELNYDSVARCDAMLKQIDAMMQKELARRIKL